LVIQVQIILCFCTYSLSQAIQRTRALLLQQGANRVLVNVLDELFIDGAELLDDIETTDFAVQVL
jgi:hypothetical protein